MNPKYPVYIVSKGRWKIGLTSKALDEIGVDYKIVVEPQEVSAYANYVEQQRILVLPE